MDDDEGESQLTNLLELIDDDCVARVLRPAPHASGASPSEQRGQLRPLPAATASEADEPPAKTLRLRSVKLEGDSAGASPAPVKSKAPVACSSAESEYYAMCSGAAEGLFVEALALEMGMQVGGVVLLTDASVAKAMAEKSSIPNRVKHMMIRYLFLQQLLRERRIALQKVGTEDNRADLMTKAVTAPILEKLPRQFGLEDSGASRGSARSRRADVAREGLEHSVPEGHGRDHGHLAFPGDGLHPRDGCGGRDCWDPAVSVLVG